MMKMTTTIIVLALLALMQLEPVQSAAIGEIAKNVHSDLVFFDAGLNPQQTRRSRRLDLETPAGGAVDLFYRYGFFSLSVRVVPRDDPGKWLVREPTADIFDKTSVVKSEVAGADTFARQPFQIFLCEDLQELLDAYFHDFKADGVEVPHKLFTGSWRLPTAASYLGLSPKALDGSENSYVLVKLVREKNTQSVAGRIRLDQETGADARAVNPGDNDAILKFVKNYGTHYFRSITVGESVYQVFAISKDQMQSLSSSFAGRGRLSLNEWPTLYEKYLQPGFVLETGEIKAASGDEKLQRFMDQALRIEGQTQSYPNLIEGLIKNPGNVQRLEELSKDSTAIVGLDFASLRDFFPSPEVRAFYDETFAAQSALWGANI